MFALNHPTPFDFPQRARAPKLQPHVLPRMGELDFWRPQDRNRSLQRRTELPFYVLQSHKDFSETDQFSLSNFPQELELDVPQTAFDSPSYEMPNSLPRSTAAELSWLRGSDQQASTPFGDFLKDDFELTSPHAPPTSHTVETRRHSTHQQVQQGVQQHVPPTTRHADFYSRGMENSFPAAAIKSDSSKSSRDCVKRPVRKAVDVELLEEGVFPEVCLKIHSRYQKAENSSEFILQVKKEIRLPGNRTPMAVALPNLDGYTKVHNKHTPGKKPKLKARWTLICNHCGKIFCARPTPKNSRYVVNHICPTHTNKRKQFVIGTKARRCETEHEGPCIQQLMRLKTMNDL